MRLRRLFLKAVNCPLAAPSATPVKNSCNESQDGDRDDPSSDSVALPFFAILMAIIEAGLYFFASQVMDTGFRDAARQIRTGQAANMSLEDFRTTMCNLMNQSTGLFNCANLYIDKKVLVDYNDAASMPLDASGNFDASQMEWQYACGSQIVLVRAFYEWPSYANLLGSSIANGPSGLSNGNILMNSTAVFRTEPYGGCT